MSATTGVGDPSGRSGMRAKPPEAKLLDDGTCLPARISFFHVC